MQLGMIGLGRMGANMARRLLRAGHECVVFDIDSKAVDALKAEGASGVQSLEQLVSVLTPPRVVWLMLPAALVDKTVGTLAGLLNKDDIVVDGGNSYYRDDMRRAKALQDQSIHYVDVGVSGGVWGLERGYCQMIGGEKTIIDYLDPVFAALAPGQTGDVTHSSGTAGHEYTPALGYLHAGKNGAGHFVKMIHNGIEYGMMAAYAEGFNILRHANIGSIDRGTDAETAPLEKPENYQYDFNLPQIAEVWRHGSVISSWLLDLIAMAMHDDPDLDNFTGHISDSGEGRWTNIAAIEAGVPAPVLSTALFSRFSSRDEADFANRLLSAMRFEFGGHHEKKLGK